MMREILKRGDMSMKITDIAGTVFEVRNDALIVRKKNGKETAYNMNNMLYPKDIKDGLLGNCSFLIKFSDGKVLQIMCKKENKEELEKFWICLGTNYSRIASTGSIETLHSKTDSGSQYKMVDSLKLLECPCCGGKVSNQAENCPHCGHPINTKHKIQQEKNPKFNGVYRKTLFSGLQEVYCPRCGSENCSHYQEQKIIPSKTKTRYTANLNPLKPFTLLNKKEKVVKKEQVITESKFICNSCGKIFY